MHLRHASRKNKKSLRNPTCGAIGTTHINDLVSEKRNPLKVSFVQNSVVGKPPQGEVKIWEGIIVKK